MAENIDSKNCFLTSALLAFHLAACNTTSGPSSATADRDDKTVTRQECTVSGTSFDGGKVTLMYNRQRQATVLTRSNGDVAEFVVTADGSASRSLRSGDKTKQPISIRYNLTEQFSQTWLRINDFWVERYPKSPAAELLRKTFSRSRESGVEPVLGGRLRIAPQAGDKQFGITAGTEFGARELDTRRWLPSTDERSWLSLPLPLETDSEDNAWNVSAQLWHKRPSHPKSIEWTTKQRAQSRGSSIKPKVTLVCSAPIKGPGSVPRLAETSGMSSEQMSEYRAATRRAAEIIPLQLAAHGLLAGFAQDRQRVTAREVVRRLVTGFQLFCTDFVIQNHARKEVRGSSKALVTADSMVEDLENYLRNQPNADRWGETLLRVADAIGIEDDVAMPLLSEAAWAGCVAVTNPELRPGEGVGNVIAQLLRGNSQAANAAKTGNRLVEKQRKLSISITK